MDFLFTLFYNHFHLEKYIEHKSPQWVHGIQIHAFKKSKKAIHAIQALMESYFTLKETIV